MRKILSIMALLVISLLTFSMVSALESKDLEWGTVKVNDDVITDNSVLSVEEGQKLSVHIGLKANADINDVEVDAKISGYNEYSSYESLSDATTLFDVKSGTTKYVNLEVNLPKKLEKSEYLLRLRVMDKDTPALEKDIQLAVEPVRHGVDIADVAFSPGNTVKAGRSLLTTVLLQNYGDKDEKDVKVTVAVPQLGISATEFVDALVTDNHNVKYEDVPEMFLSIPANTAAGEYDVKVTASYDDAESVSKTFKISVVANEMFQASDKLVLAVGPEIQNVAVGKTATYAIALTNAGATSKAYMLEAVTGSWATATLSESLVVLEPGKNKVVYVEVTPNADAAVGGEQTVSVAIKSGSNLLETISLKANVVQGKAAAAGNLNLRNGLEIALIVLVVLLVIIGLIIGFSRLKKDNEEDKTYY